MVERSVLMIFLDGVGIGKDDPEINPFARLDARIFNHFEDRKGRMPRKGVCLPTDACLGVEGLPQSATGQVTLFTGENAAGYLGYHLQGFPNRALKELLQAGSIFKRIREQGGQVTFANAYTPRYLKKKRSWISATTAMCETAGVPLRTVADIAAGRAVYFDLTNARLANEGYDLPVRSAERAAEVLVSLARSFNLCLYEYFLTDRAGHRGTIEEAVGIVDQVDRLISAAVELIDLSKSSLLVCSDHGNLEDKTTRLHTRNPVPTLVWGDLRNFLPLAPTLQDITPAVVRYLAERN
jgi:2,3-bisphosphoglycerate-independent phosphoglycerate mutase